MKPEPSAKRHPPHFQERADLYGLPELEKIWPDLLDFTRRYWTDPESMPVYTPFAPGEVFRSLPHDLPEDGVSLKELLCHFQTALMPGLLHWNHPGFFGFFPCNTSAPSVASALITATLNVNPFSWNAGPAATELEAKMVSWFAREAGLDWKGCLQDTASSATLCAVVSARERARIAAGHNQAGPPTLERLCAYVSAETHNSVAKAVYLAGIPRANIRTISTRPDLTMDPADLEKKLLEDHANGFIPFFVCSTIGSTSSTACDDISANGKAIKTFQASAKLCFHPWHHVDAALAGSLILLPECAHLFRSLHESDSFVFNPHKWLFTHFECCVLLAKNSHEITESLSDNPSYLKELHARSDSIEGVEDFRNWSVQLGRGFRALKLWFVLRHFGKRNLQERLRRHLEMTQTLARRFETVGLGLGFTLLCKPQLNTICFCRGDDLKTLQFHKITRDRGLIYLTPTTINGRYWIRVAIGQTALIDSDLENLWTELESCCKLQDIKGDEN